MDPAMRTVVSALRKRGVDEDALVGAIATADRSGRPLATVLVDDQVVTDLQWATAVADAYGLRAVELATTPVDASAMSLVPLPLARRHSMVPISSSSGTLTVAVIDPGNVLGIDDIRAATGLTIDPVVVTTAELNRLLERYSRSATDLDEAAAELRPRTARTSSRTSTTTPRSFGSSALLERAITSRASDIHLEPSEFDLRVRIASTACCTRSTRCPRAVQARADLATEDHVQRRHHRATGTAERPDHVRTRRPQRRPAHRPRCRRCGARRSCSGCSTPAASTSTCSKLGFTDDNYARFSTRFRKPHGMVLVTGPTGSGKSTTLYATLTEIRNPEVNVITVEDPVEYRIDGINQVQVNLKAGLTFAAVLPAILRSDPDVVLIGEIRDRADRAARGRGRAHRPPRAVHAAHQRRAERGHPSRRDGHRAVPGRLVAGLRAGPAAGPPAVRLVQAGRTSRTPSELQAAALADRDSSDPTRCGRRSAAARAPNTGYRGRLAINEVMPVSEEIERLTVTHASATEIARAARSEGMVTLRDDGLRKAQLGVTTMDEVLRVTA